MIQIVGINAEMLAEVLFPSAQRPCVNRRDTASGRKKGGIRIAEAAFEAEKTGVLALSRFTAR